MPEPTAPHVFVYGTLRRGESNDITRLRPAPRFVGLAQLAGTLYDLGPYPGMRLGGAESVYGEVYAISAELERVMDEIEEMYPQPSGEYDKQVVPVAVQDAVLPCIVYQISTAHISGKPVIVGGDWLER